MTKTAAMQHTTPRAQIIDGRAVAALFQDELIRLEAETDSARPPASFRNDWSEGITVEVDAGGLSLTDAYTALTRWLGKETYIDGGLSRTTDGLARPFAA